MNALRFLVACVCGSIAAQSVESALNALELPFLLTTPRIDRLSTSIPIPDGDDIQVELPLGLDGRGRFVCDGECTVDGKPVTVTGKGKARDGVFAFRLVIRGIRPEGRGLSVKLSGELNDALSSCRYRGPRGRIRRDDCPLTISADENVVGTIEFTPRIDCNGRISGTATVRTGLGNDPDSESSLQGKRNIDRGTLRLAVKERGRKVTFRGELTDAGFS